MTSTMRCLAVAMVMALVVMAVTAAPLNGKPSKLGEGKLAIKQQNSVLARDSSAPREMPLKQISSIKSETLLASLGKTKTGKLAPLPATAQSPVTMVTDAAKQTAQEMTSDVAGNSKQAPNSDNTEMGMSELGSEAQAFVGELASIQGMTPEVAGTGIDMSPQAMAEYLLLTDDFEGMEQAIADLVAADVLTAAEALSYRNAVAVHYDALVQSELDATLDYLQEDAPIVAGPYEERFPQQGAFTDYENVDVSQQSQRTQQQQQQQTQQQQQQQNVDLDRLLQSVLDSIANGNTDIIATPPQGEINAELDARKPASDVALEEELESLPDVNQQVQDDVTSDAVKTGDDSKQKTENKDTAAASTAQHATSRR